MGSGIYTRDNLVGMSAVLRMIAACAVGMEVPGISPVMNYAVGIAPSTFSHGEVLEAGRAADPRISQLFADIVRIVDRAGSGAAWPLVDAD